MNREHSSAGSEHLPYKQGVTGSNPVAPTNNRKGFRRKSLKPFFYFYHVQGLYKVVFYLINK